MNPPTSPADVYLAHVEPAWLKSIRSDLDAMTSAAPMRPVTFEEVEASVRALGPLQVEARPFVLPYRIPAPPSDAPMQNLFEQERERLWLHMLARMGPPEPKPMLDDLRAAEALLRENNVTPQNNCVRCGARCYHVKTDASDGVCVDCLARSPT